MSHRLDMQYPPLGREMSKEEIYGILSSYGKGWQILSKAIILTKRGTQGSVVAEIVWGEEHPMYDGHFDGNPIFPGVIQAEAVGHAAALHAILWNGKEEIANEVTPVVQEAHAKFLKPISRGSYKIYGQPSKKKGLGPSKESSRVFYYGAAVKDKKEVAAIVECKIVFVKRKVFGRIAHRSRNTGAESSQ